MVGSKHIAHSQKKQFMAYRNLQRKLRKDLIAAPVVIPATL